MAHENETMALAIRFSFSGMKPTEKSRTISSITTICLQ